MQRHLETLERLLDVPAADLKIALAYATDRVAEALLADKVDAFIYDPTRDSLVALGSSNQPLSAEQRRHGLDVLPLSNGGRAVAVYRTGRTFLAADTQDDAEELRGIRDTLHVRAQIGVPLEVGGVRRGVVMAASQKPSFWNDADVRFAEAVARWMGMIAHRAELSEQIARNAVEQGRRAAAEELITVMAHDLRNYMMPIEMRVAFVRRRAERDQRVPDVRDLDLALKGLQRLSAIVGDLLDVARIDQGVLQIEPYPVPLAPLLEEIASALATPDHGIDVRSSDELVVVVDPQRLRQCVENLLSNALKHSPDRAPVTVTVRRVTRLDGEMAQVEVADQGPGVAPDVGAHIFERFVSGQKREGGLGLGLYLAKRIAVLHGGDLVFDSEPGRGARFCLRLPIATAND